MKKYFSMELNKAEWALIRPILKSLDCTYEASGCGALIHVEVCCTPDVAEAISSEIDKL